MKILNLLVLIIFLFNLNVSNAKDRNLNSKITKNLRCLICQGQSIHDSDTEFANSLKLVVEKRLQRECRRMKFTNFLRQNMGNGYYMTHFKPKNLYLWLLPLLLFLIGGAIIFKNLKIKKIKHINPMKILKSLFY